MLNGSVGDDLAVFHADNAACMPGDVGLTGYDGSDLAEALEITTVRQPFRRTGVEAVGLLLSRLGGYAGPPREVMLQPEFVPGATS